MWTNRLLSKVLVASVLSLGAVGCFRADLDGLDKKLLWEFRAASIDKKLSMKLGPVTMSLANVIVTFAPVEREAKRAFRGIRSVDLVVYELEGSEDSAPCGSLLEFAAGRLKRKGWEPIVEAREPGSMVLVLCKYDEVRIRGIYVIVLDEESLVLVKLRGNLNKVFAAAMEMAERPEPMITID